ncbi:TadE/TadG family type IV pilus assembly protein [Phenylobacterium deserti]|uniref:TadE-like domain-containing protein n=1 Tax=Phenylobacterium deserti TaxID=1914756 RepID=A0A328AY85_9CAUL|nr:TadE/TadG family type IV pilus assembly protein [Phenylobacterium deserti]RAK57788.1 hypothetical protein DJ018_07670 [Phenylobacterium deserti]
MLNRFRRDEGGAAAVEFALFAPVLVLLYFGTVELSLALLADRHSAHAAAVIADLTTQPASLSENEITDILGVAAPIMRPFPTSGMTTRISMLQGDSNNVARVVWSRSQTMTPLAVNNAPAAVKIGVLKKDERAVLSEVNYSYTSPIGHIVSQPMTFRNHHISWPRRRDVTIR